MRRKIGRPLNDPKMVEHFLFNALGYDLRSKSKYNVVGKIVTVELILQEFDENQITMKSQNFRTKSRGEGDRMDLWKQIVNELLTIPRLPDDDKIKIKKGGAFPLNGISCDRQAYIVIGLPASGKSSVAAYIADEKRALILDSDYAKRKLPEYDQFPFGASLVHAESDAIIFGTKSEPDFISLFEHCSRIGANVVIPKIGNNPETIMNLIKNLKTAKYTCHLTLVDLPRETATLRAIERFKSTKRYVPLSLIFDTYANDSSLTYFRIKNKKGLGVKSFGIVNTNNPIDKKTRRVEATSNENGAALYPLI